LGKGNEYQLASLPLFLASIFDPDEVCRISTKSRQAAASSLDDKWTGNPAINMASAFIHRLSDSLSSASGAYRLNKRRGHPGAGRVKGNPGESREPRGDSRYATK